MKKKWIIVVALLFGIISTQTSLLFAEEESEGPPQQHMRKRAHRGNPVQHVLRFQEELELTEEQVEKLKAIEPTDKDVIQEAHKAVQEAMKALRQSVQEGASEETIRGLATEVGNAMGDLHVLKAQDVAKVQEILTEEQYAKLKELAQERMQQRKQHGSSDGPRNNRRGSRHGGGRRRRY